MFSGFQGMEIDASSNFGKTGNRTNVNWGVDSSGQPWKGCSLDSAESGSAPTYCSVLN